MVISESGLNIPVESEPPRRRWIRGAGVAIAIILVGGGILAWCGMLPWHAPMDPGPLGGSSGYQDAPLGKPRPWPALWVYNPSRVGVTLDGVSFAADNLRGLRIVDAWLPAPTARCMDLAADPGETPGSCRRPIAGYHIPAQTPTGNAPRLVVMVEADHPGQYVSPGFVVHYHVGFVNYSTTYQTGLVFCTEGERCPNSLLRQAEG